MGAWVARIAFRTAPQRTVIKLVGGLQDTLCVWALISSGVLNARETVAVETPACFATSRMLFMETIVTLR